MDPHGPDAPEPAPTRADPTRVVLAVDPGRAKCGYALVDGFGDVSVRGIVDTAGLPALVASLCSRWSPCAILVGDGTCSAAALEALSALGLPAPILAVDERHTSEAARARCVAETPAHGWRRLVPRSLRTPDGPYDDYVAVILAERWWAAQ